MAKRILLVDDEPLIVKGLKYTLEQEGFETDSAADGEEALTKFFSGHFDFILLDVMLPKKNGFDVCRALRDQGSALGTVHIVPPSKRSMGIRSIIARAGARVNPLPQGHRG